MPEVVRHVIDVGPHSGVEVYIAGGDADIIQILRGGIHILDDDIRDGRDQVPADIGWTKAETGTNDWNISARRGTDRDVFWCFAVRGNNVTRSGDIRYGQGHPEWRNYPFDWIDANTLRIRYGPNIGHVAWDQNTLRWITRD